MSDWAKDCGKNLEQVCKAYAYRTAEQKRVKEEKEYLEKLAKQHDDYMRHFEETGEW